MANHDSDPGAFDAVVGLQSEIQIPAASLTVHFDVNDYLQGHTETELFSLMGRLKDFFTPIPDQPA